MPDSPRITRRSQVEAHQVDTTPLAEDPAVARSPASKWDWEKALVARSRAEGMTAGCQHVALLLSTYANGDGTSIRPTVETLSTVSGKGQSTVKEALRYLREHGWVHQMSRGQTGRVSEYRLTIPPRVQ